MDQIKNELENLRRTMSNIITPYTNFQEHITLIETVGILIQDLELQRQQILFLNLLVKLSMIYFILSL